MSADLRIAKIAPTDADAATGIGISSDTDTGSADEERPERGVTARNLTDSGNAKRMAEYFGKFLRYCAAMLRWWAWDSRRWVLDERNAALACTEKVIGKIYGEAAQARKRGKADLAEALVEFAHDCESASKRRAMLELARAEPPFPIAPTEFDRDKSLFNVANGTLDLRTGSIRPHDRADHITKVSPVRFDPLAKAELWRAFLCHVLPNAEVRAFVQRFAGYCLTGDVTAHAMLFFHGSGSNGKSTFINAMLALLGDYGWAAPPELLLADKHSRHPTEVAALAGVRLAISTELEAGSQLASARLKLLVSEDPITARRMHENFWTFSPQHKLIIATNHKPSVSDDSDGVWRRIFLVPFNVQIPEAEKNTKLGEQLRAELPGILNWALEGLLAWQAGGLNAPAAVVAASTNYRREQDAVGRFLADRCQLGEALTCAVGELRKAYEAWCKAEGELAVSGKAMTQALNKRGIESDRLGSGARVYKGVSVVREDADDESERGGAKW